MKYFTVNPDKLSRLYLTLGQYPLLSNRIRAAMRRELFENGFIQPQVFELEVRDYSIQTQRLAGLRNPYAEEPADVWEFRLNQVREYLTDILFADFCSLESLEKIIQQILSNEGVQVSPEVALSENPELSPLDQVLEQALEIERMPAATRARYEARLEESKVVLIRALISDQLRYIAVAKQYFHVQDLAEIRRRRIGTGRIGGKAAGMMLAYRILIEAQESEGDTSNGFGCLRVPESWFIGSDLLYTFMALNRLFHWNDQKYKTESEMRADYPLIVEEFEQGQFPQDFLESLRILLRQLGKTPIIVRSSSHLEDNFGTAFAGKYESIFCPNQGSLDENLDVLTRAIAHIYASTLNPNALLYRRSRGLQDYDERMAILLQVVQGEQFGRYFLPHGAGVAFSRNLYRWAPQIRREDGFVRLVWGLGTRAVDRVGNDYPRLVALSHPRLRPSTDPRSVRRYSQQYVDVIDLKENTFKTLPVNEVISPRYPPLRYLVQVDEDGYLSSIRSSTSGIQPSQMVLTFEDLLGRTKFADHVRAMLHRLEEAYHSPVDMEFTLHVEGLDTGQPQVCVSVLQCRPQSQLLVSEHAALPPKLLPEDVIFLTRFVVPQGYISRVDYVLFVTPEGYFSLPSANARSELVRAIGRLNAALAGRNFICVGPGRWGSSNPDLGVSIDYGDIYHARSLVELAGEGIGLPPEPSLGTHFFQDLLEAQIYPLAIYLDDPKNSFNRDFFYKTPSIANEFTQIPPELEPTLRLIPVAKYRSGHHIRIVMDDNESQAVAFLEPDPSL